MYYTYARRCDRHNIGSLGTTLYIQHKKYLYNHVCLMAFLGGFCKPSSFSLGSHNIIIQDVEAMIIDYIITKIVVWRQYTHCFNVLVF